jgi:hypothetical protein
MLGITASMLTPGVLVVSMLLALAPPALAKTVRYDPQVVYYTYCHSHPPAAHRLRRHRGHQDP